MRLATANTYDNVLTNLMDRQAGLADMQEKLSAGKKVIRASDDPTGAAQAERAMNRQVRVDVEQRALNIQRNSISMAESTLGDSLQLMQTMRELIVSAGNGAQRGTDRTSIAQQIAGLRDQLFAKANAVDSNGVPLFGGLGSSPAPFIDNVTGVTYNGLPGQTASTPASIPSVMDGQAAWMNVPTGNGVFTSAINTLNVGGLFTDIGQVTNPSLVTGHNYSIDFTIVAGVTEYTVTDVTTSTPVLTAQPYVSGRPIQFDGLSITPQGNPAMGDSVQIAPSTITNVFGVLDTAIAQITNAPSNNVTMHNISTALAQLDSAMNRISAARGQAGDLLNRADTIDSNQQAKAVQLAADRSRAEDMDMAKGISEFQTQQNGYDAALRTYAQVQRLSLFNYMS